jgi:hypothetical protein
LAELHDFSLTPCKARGGSIPIKNIMLDTADVRSNNFPCVTQFYSAVAAEPRHPGWRVR